MTDREGDEPDGMDETIVPYDSGRDPFENRDITDDELYVRLLALVRVTPFVTAIFDCCHSGTILRDAFGDRGRWVPEDRRPISELPPSTVARDVGSYPPGPSGWLPLGERYVLIAGCRDEESSFEHTVTEDGVSVTHGALTYFLSCESPGPAPGPPIAMYSKPRAPRSRRPSPGSTRSSRVRETGSCSAFGRSSPCAMLASDLAWVEV